MERTTFVSIFGSTHLHCRPPPVPASVCPQSWCGLKIHNQSLNVAKAGSIWIWTINLDLTPVSVVSVQRRPLLCLRRGRADAGPAWSGVDTWSPHPACSVAGLSPPTPASSRLRVAVTPSTYRVSGQVISPTL